MPTSDRRALLVYAMVVATAIVVHAVQPSVADELYLGVVLLAFGASWLGRFRHPPACPVPWRWLRAGLGFAGLALLLAYLASGEPQLRTPLRALHLLGYVCIAAVAWTLGRGGARLPAVDRGVASALSACAGAIVAFVFVAQPLWASGAVTDLAGFLRTVFPMLSLAIAAVVLRQLSGSSAVPPAHGLVAAGIVLFFVADLVGAVELFVGGSGAQRTFQLVAFSVLGAAMLHPSVRERPDTRPVDNSSLSRTELVAILLAGVGAPLSLVVRSDAAAVDELLVVGTASAVLMLLVLARLWRVLRALRAATKREDERRFRSLVENASDVISVVAPDGRTTYVSPTAERVWGYSPEELAVAGFDVVVEEDRPGVREAFREVVDAGPGAIAQVEGRSTHGDGTRRWFEAVYANRLDDDAVRGVVVTSRDVTARHDLEQRLWDQAYVDPLTGLPNRARLLEELEDGLRGCGQEACPALLVFGVDDLKTINDSLGPQRGDELLRTVGDRLRSGEVEGATVARLGGDEFALLLPRCGGLEVAVATARRALSAIGRPVTLGGRRVEPQASCGVAIGGDTTPASELLREAEAALHEAKREARGGHRVFDPEMHRTAVRRLQLQMDLASSIEREQLWVAYQPIHEIRTGRLIGVEALLRWDHPVRGAVPPDEFVPLAEASGRIAELGRFVLRRACEDLAELGRTTGLDLALSVNLSPAQLGDPGLTTTVAEALADSGLPAQRLTLEVTEGVFLERSAAVIQALEELRALGTRLAIDDFGTGYCALGYLMTFRFDIVKIDRSFIKVLDEPGSDRRVTLGILDLVAKLEVPAVAEGIETASQLEELRAIGCEYGQGYYWSRPVPVTELPLPVPTARSNGIPRRSADPLPLPPGPAG